MTDITEARRKFEEWMRASSAEHIDDIYGRAYWQVWQAALDSVVVEMPTPTDAMNVVMAYQDSKNRNVTGTTNWAANLGMYVVSACQEAIHAAGVRTK